MATIFDLEKRKRFYFIQKRIFDIVVSSILLILLSPLFLIVALLIRLENPGPIFYKSKRVGRNYKVFDFYKFRSMRTDADKLLAQMKHLNQYAGDENDAKSQNSPLRVEAINGMVLIGNEGWVSENKWLDERNTENARSFVKFQNDPRITRIGHFIRNTSIDELPQLLNVLKGDMSLVGNRPLPPYEAEKLTNDEAITRFFAPAGITGLWQVTERGKKDTTAESRINLDNVYAHKCSMWLDIWILVRTPFAAIQKENV